jgi:carboxyl-terminal processing protease
VIVDLRQNPGGVSVPMGYTVGEFFPKSMPWGRFTSRNGQQTDNSSWQWGSARFEGRVVVLVSGRTASCAEIFARALQYHKRATIVGRQTAGAVIGSSFYSLPGGGKLQLGLVDYHGLDGQRLEGAGVKPDVAVAKTFGSIGDLRAGRDRDLEAALNALRADGARPSPGGRSGQH